MKANLPWFLIAIFISLSFFYYFNQKNRIRKDERRARAKEKHEEYLQSLISNIKNNEPGKAEDLEI